MFKKISSTLLPLDPDQDLDSESGSGSKDLTESGSNPDTDPKHWFKGTVAYGTESGINHDAF